MNTPAFNPTEVESPRADSLPDPWTTAYANLHRDGLALFPPACLYYVLELVRRTARTNLFGNASEQGKPHEADTDLSPRAMIEAFRAAVRTDFGPLAKTVLEDWGLGSPSDLGRAISLLAQAGCLRVSADDAVEHYARETSSFLTDSPQENRS